MLAPAVCEAATNGDQAVIEILEEGARVLSEYTEVVAARLHLLAPKIMLLGGLFHRDSIYTHTFRRRLKKILPDARVATVDQPPEMGAAWLAAELHEHPIGWQKNSAERLDDLAVAMTEQHNTRSANLEQMNPRELVQLFVDEEKFVDEALQKATDDLARAVQIVAEAMRKGGRLFYVRDWPGPSFSLTTWVPGMPLPAASRLAVAAQLAAFIRALQSIEAPGFGALVVRDGQPARRGRRPRCRHPGLGDAAVLAAWRRAEFDAHVPLAARPSPSRAGLERRRGCRRPRPRRRAGGRDPR